MSTILQLILRHLLTALGGIMAESGWAGVGTDNQEFVSQVVGAGMFIAGVAWSVIHKKKTGELPSKKKEG